MAKFVPRLPTIILFVVTLGLLLVNAASIVDIDHTRTKYRRSHDTQGDILSDLPRDVIHEICERLPLLDAARMSVLSHKWLDIWTSTPHLVFDYVFFYSVLKGEAQETKYGSIVSKILFQHEGPIHKFSLFVPPLKSCLDVAQWISHLSRNGLREFRLSNLCDARLKLNLSGDLEKLTLNIRGFQLISEAFQS
ncbi:F-box/FBD/LRR-repeat protein At1g13570-like [Spinacia oleracea]|uniref:F-box/FBD/LRR-repeat protein At1g13570-like n=1 Tax=Spinacia oleracea TaxID=3562 RepID=A0ABM3R4B5_SPIOL|nr:F-box/FBD/LRR-repeat protein At1g13570-like [Spinacia oleracea]